MNTEHIENPFVSVVMSVYNAEPFLAESIESILAQTYPHFEFIIVLDSGSRDNSYKVVDNFAGRDKRIRVLRVPHCGASEALNAGIDVAKGDYIAQMEPDDIALPERFQVQLDWMRLTSVDVCGACVKCFGDSSRILWFPEGHAAIRSDLIFRSALQPTTVIARAKVFKKNRYAEGVVFQDYELWTRLALKYRMGNVQQFLVQYRRHPEQTSQIKASQVHEDLRTYRHRYFYALYPEAKAEDYDAVANVGDGKPHKSLQELHLAGTWLLRLADSPDRFLRERMAQKWLAVCQRSAHLGMACFHLYQEIVTQFQVPDLAKARKLWLMCIVHAGSESGLMRLLRSLSHGMG